MTTTVISSREDCEKTPTSESLESIHDTLVCPQYETNLIIFKEGLHSIWAEFNNISCTVRVSYEVRLDSKFTVRIGRVTPEDVDNKLLLNR